jgi:hypothetical protein
VKNTGKELKITIIENSSFDRKYIGNFKNGYRSGEGKVYKLQNNELFYEGTFKNGYIVKGTKYKNGQNRSICGFFFQK